MPRFTDFKDYLGVQILMVREVVFSEILFLTLCHLDHLLHCIQTPLATHPGQLSLPKQKCVIELFLMHLDFEQTPARCVCLCFLCLHLSGSLLVCSPLASDACPLRR